MSFTWISNAIDQLMTVHGSLFLGEAQSWAKWLGIIILCIFGIKWALATASGHGGYDLPGLIHFVILFSIVSFALSHYDTPLPWVNASVPMVLPNTADELCQRMNDVALKDAAKKLKYAEDNLEDPPSILEDAQAWFKWLLVFCAMTGSEVFMFLANIVGYLGLGVLVLMGPIFIPWLMVPKLSWLFWNWLSALMQFAFWRVIATAISLVFASAWGAFLDHVMVGDYSAAHYTELYIYFVVLSLATIVSMAYLPIRLTSDVFKGGASIGPNWAAVTAVAARALS